MCTLECHRPTHLEVCGERAADSLAEVSQVLLTVDPRWARVPEALDRRARFFFAAMADQGLPASDDGSHMLTPGRRRSVGLN